MNVLMVATGSRGDVEPYLALGRALMVAGHLVCFVTTSDFVDLAMGFGLDVAEIRVNVRERLADPGVRRELQERGPVVAFRAMAALAREATQLAVDTATEAAAGSEVVVTGLGGHQPALAAARAHHLPLVRAFNVPLTPTAAYPGTLFPRWPAGPGGVLNLASHHLSRLVVGVAGRRSLQSVWDPFDLGRSPGRCCTGSAPPCCPDPPTGRPKSFRQGSGSTSPLRAGFRPQALSRSSRAGLPPCISVSGR